MEQSISMMALSEAGSTEELDSKSYAVNVLASFVAPSWLMCSVMIDSDMLGVHALTCAIRAHTIHAACTKRKLQCFYI